jgi:hypothetical protein
MAQLLTLVANCPGLPELAAVSWSTMTEECEFEQLPKNLSWKGDVPIRG